jgi:hypothetical protein
MTACPRPPLEKPLDACCSKRRPGWHRTERGSRTSRRGLALAGMLLLVGSPLSWW